MTVEGCTAKGSSAFKYAMPRGANRVGAGAVKKTRQKNVKPATRKAYERAAAAADNKLAAA